MKSILLVSHGSRSPRTKQELRALVRTLRYRSRIKILEYAFLDVATPNIPQGIARCVGKGATEIMLLLNFLNSGRHVDRDMPAIVRKAQRRHPNIKFTISPPIGLHPKMAELFLDLLK